MLVLLSNKANDSTKWACEREHEPMSMSKWPRMDFLEYFDDMDKILLEYPYAT
jgi:hypothetical protein